MQIIKMDFEISFDAEKSFPGTDVIKEYLEEHLQIKVEHIGSSFPKNDEILPGKLKYVECNLDIVCSCNSKDEVVQAAQEVLNTIDQIDDIEAGNYYIVTIEGRSYDLERTELLSN